MGIKDITENLRKILDDNLRAAQMDDEDALVKAADGKEKVYRRASLVDPYMIASYGGGSYGAYRPRYSHISFKTLKEMSLRDPIIAAIIQTRINQITAFSRPQNNKYDTGFKVLPKDPNLEVESGSAEEKEIEFITKFIQRTGMDNEYRDEKDRMDFDTWLKLMTRDRLTYGAAAIETIRTAEGRIFAFLPCPTETIYYANKSISSSLIQNLKIVNKASFFAGTERAETIQELEDKQQRDFKEKLINKEFEFVQVIEGRIVEGFTRDELIYKLGNPQNFIDNNGYAIGELEMATNVVTAHLQAANYNKLFFTHGFAARGVLHIKGDVTPSQLQAFRAQWYAQVSGNANSWRTPVLAGAEEVQWIPLSATNRDMEYSAYIDHIIRILCSLFQISPLEFGFDYLDRGSGQKTLSESDNSWKIKESQNRGLRPLLIWLETIINDEIIPGIDPSYGAKYSFCFVGLDAESKREELERQEQEINVHASINDVRKEIEKDPILGGEIPLNQAYINTLMRTHTIGEIRENIFGYAGDAGSEDFSYIADPSFFQNRQQLMPQQNPNVQVDEQGNPIEQADEQGNPIPQVDEQGNPIEQADEQGNPLAPAEGQAPDQMGKEQLYQMVANYIQNNPDLITKSLENEIAKSSKPSDISRRFDKIRNGYIETSKDIQSEMLKEILGVVKDEILEDDKPEKNSK